MQLRYPPDPRSCQRMNTSEIKQKFLVDDLFMADWSELVYWCFDRSIVGSAVPTHTPLVLNSSKELSTKYFAQAREIGVLNIGQDGFVSVDGIEYHMSCRDMLYIGKGSRNIEFNSLSADAPARFYMVSYPAHTAYPTALVRREDAMAVSLGCREDANIRTIRRYIHPGGAKSCQLVMGVTDLEDGTVWNTMPSHTHARRSEIYMYFDLDDDSLVFHLMGEPSETRHLVVRNEQVVLSPSWSIHSGVGTRRYSFVWAMGGENQDFDDMDGVGMHDLA